MISTQQSPPISPKSAPISPLNRKGFFSQESSGKGVERPWKRAQQHHQQHHTVKYPRQEGEKDDRQTTTPLISSPTNVIKANPEELYRQLINGKNSNTPHFSIKPRGVGA